MMDMLKFSLITISCVVLVVNPLMEEAWQNEEKVLEFSEGRMDTKLQVKPFVIETDVGDDVIQCLGKCLEYSPTCKGINFLSSSASGQTSVCEILEHSFDDRDTRKKLVCAHSWIYYGISQISFKDENLSDLTMTSSLPSSSPSPTSSKSQSQSSPSPSPSPSPSLLPSSSSPSPYPTSQSQQFLPSTTIAPIETYTTTTPLTKTDTPSEPLPVKELEATSGGVRCYGSSDRTFAQLTVPESGEVLYFKFIHQNGGFTCDPFKYPQAKQNPIWGCFSESDTIVTTEANNLLISIYSQESNDNTFTLFYNPITVTAYQRFKIWTKENFEGRSTSYAIPGHHCVTVAVGYIDPTVP